MKDATKELRDAEASLEFMPDLRPVWEEFLGWEVKLARRGTGLSDAEKVGAFVALRRQVIHD